MGAEGKLFFLSIAWTVRSKRRKRDSARVRRGISSIELESSFTVPHISIIFFDQREKRRDILYLRTSSKCFR